MNKQLLKFLVVGLCFTFVGSSMEAIFGYGEGNAEAKTEDKKVEEPKKADVKPADVKPADAIKTDAKHCAITQHLIDWNRYYIGFTVVGLAAAVTAYVMLNQNDENTDEEEAV